MERVRVAPTATASSADKAMAAIMVQRVEAAVRAFSCDASLPCSTWSSMSASSDARSFS